MEFYSGLLVLQLLEIENDRQSHHEVDIFFLFSNYLEIESE